MQLIKQLLSPFPICQIDDVLKRGKVKFELPKFL